MIVFLNAFRQRVVKGKGICIFNGFNKKEKEQKKMQFQKFKNLLLNLIFLMFQFVFWYRHLFYHGWQLNDLISFVIF